MDTEIEMPGPRSRWKNEKSERSFVVWDVRGLNLPVEKRLVILMEIKNYEPGEKTKFVEVPMPLFKTYTDSNIFIKVSEGYDITKLVLEE